MKSNDADIIYSLQIGAPMKRFPAALILFAL
jgi:hypothetical protein